MAVAVYGSRWGQHMAAVICRQKNDDTGMIRVFQSSLGEDNFRLAVETARVDDYVLFPAITGAPGALHIKDSNHAGDWLIPTDLYQHWNHKKLDSRSNGHHILTF